MSFISSFSSHLVSSCHVQPCPRVSQQSHCPVVAAPSVCSTHTHTHTHTLSLSLSPPPSKTRKRSRCERTRCRANPNRELALQDKQDKTNQNDGSEFTSPDKVAERKGVREEKKSQKQIKQDGLPAPTMSFLSSSRLGHGGGVEVCIGEVPLDAGPEPPHGGGIGNIRCPFLASTTSKKATNATKSINNDRPRVTQG